MTEKQPHEADLPKHVTRFDGELRCRNCDSTVDENGKWIDDDVYYGEDPDWCPDCDAKMKRVR
jgi:Zn finger protein HypA/HybF involved in hydrogenase expression